MECKDPGENSSFHRAFNAHALGALAEVAGPGLNVHLSTVLPPLISTMGGDTEIFTSSKNIPTDVVMLVYFDVSSLSRGFELVLVGYLCNFCSLFHLSQDVLPK